MSKALALAALFLALARPGLSSAAQLVPIAKLDLLGGQFLFKNRNTSFSGNGTWLLSPGVKLSERDMLVPSFSGQYRRTREVRELLGGGFLTMETLDNTAALKWVHAFDERWTVKPNASFKKQEISESQGETLANGLFDYNKFGLGVELERRGERFKSIRQGLNTYQVRFYNYRSLATQQQASLGTEINAGSRVLDFDAYDYAASADYLVNDKTVLSGSSLASFRPFRDQHNVQLSGKFAPDKRKDLFLNWSLSLQRKLPDFMSNGTTVAEMIGGVNLSYTRLFSNQNSFDAARTRFNPAYYNYGEFSVGPSLSMRFAKKLLTVMSYEYARRDYSKRLIQDVGGIYLPGLIWTETHTSNLSVSYPLTKNFSFKASGSYRIASSNMKFEKSYIYNYNSAHYFVGVGCSL